MGVGCLPVERWGAGDRLAAKALDFESPLPTRKFTEPEQLDRTRELVSVAAASRPTTCRP
ncbi:MAG: hypothetical protein R2697_20370 [Ilumatobacteraceae bacterium]